MTPVPSGVLSPERSGSLTLEGERGGLEAQQGKGQQRLVCGSEAIETSLDL